MRVSNGEKTPFLRPSRVRRRTDEAGNGRRAYSRWELVSRSRAPRRRIVSPPTEADAIDEWLGRPPAPWDCRRKVQFQRAGANADGGLMEAGGRCAQTGKARHDSKSSGGDTEQSRWRHALRLGLDEAWPWRLLWLWLRIRERQDGKGSGCIAHEQSHVRIWINSVIRGI